MQIIERATETMASQVADTQTDLLDAKEQQDLLDEQELYAEVHLIASNITSVLLLTSYVISMCISECSYSLFITKLAEIMSLIVIHTQKCVHVSVNVRHTAVSTIFTRVGRA